MIKSKKGATFGVLLAIVGAILITIGFAWLIANNWHLMPDMVKVAILLIVTAGAYTAGVVLRSKDYEKLGGVLLFLGGAMYTLSIFLIAQIFNFEASVQGTSYLFLLAWLGVIAASYIFNSSSSLIIALIDFLAWLSTQYIALIEDTEVGAGMFAVILLMTGVLLYGLAMLHKSRDHKFSSVYQWWTAFYILTFAYVMSFQGIIPYLWPEGLVFEGTTFIFALVIGLIAVIVFLVGSISAMSAGKIKGKEVLIFGLFVLLFFGLIFATSAVSSTLGSCYPKTCYDITVKSDCEDVDIYPNGCEWNTNNNICKDLNCYDYFYQEDCESAPIELKCYWYNDTYGGNCYSNKTYDSGADEIRFNTCNRYSNNRDSCFSKDSCQWRAGGSSFYRSGNTPVKLWVVWLFANVVLLLVILGVMGFGTKHKSAKLVNLGIIAFALTIITRYIGFVINLWGSTQLAILFIIGGVILIGGGFFLEKWRRAMISETKEGETAHHPEQ